jgi:CheY-like chemotaxis protein/HPt (histidine-containing phosphotransfer) domain-containing protein
MNDESDESMIEEFKVEAAEMFENAETGLLNIDKGMDFNSNFNSIFRSFHSLKGAAGMFGMNELQAHMHKVESLFEAQKKFEKMNKDQVDYFLSSIDAAKLLIEGESCEFNHIEINLFNVVPSVNEAPSTPKEALVVNKVEKITRKKGVVFIVDDEPDLVDVLSEILETCDYTIYKFYNGQEALDEFEVLKPDVILSDIMMPKFNGIQMLKAIYELSTTTPVIFISGNISKEKMQEALQYGATAFIDKPFDNKAVLEICQNAVKKSQTSFLLEKSINFILYQFSDLDEYLKNSGKENVRMALKAELEDILKLRKTLKSLN